MKTRKPVPGTEQAQDDSGLGQRQRLLDPAGAIGNQAVIRDLRASSSGQPLPSSVRARMEPALGEDLSRVRVHTGPAAESAADRLDARAFTLGTDIAFNRGQFQPGTPAGDAMLAHELAHVAQQRGASPNGPASQSESAAHESDATSSASRVMAELWGGVRGVLGAAGPSLRSGLSLQRCPKNQPAAKTPAPGKTAGPPAKGEGDKKGEAKDPLAGQKQSLATKFGLKAVVDGDQKWTAAELARAEKILGQLPGDGKAAIQNVTLKRVKVPACKGDPSGCFHQAVNAKTGEREDLIEMGDAAFTQDQDYEKGGTSATDLSGTKKTTVPSQDTLLHEVGHAVESAARRAAEVKRFKADKEATRKQDDLNAAIKALDRAFPAAGSMMFSSDPKEAAYQRALINAAKTLPDLTKGTDNVGAASGAVDFKDAVKATKDSIAATKKAIDLRNKAKAKLPAGSSVIDATLEQAENDSLAAAEDMLKALEARHQAQITAESATAAEEASKAKFDPGTGVIDGTKRVAELVALVHLKGIDIKKHQALSDYIKKNWPAQPDELWAELYQWSISEAPGLKVFDPDIAAYYQSPVGVKDKKLQAKVDAWLKKRAA